MIPKTICLTWETKNFELESMTDAVNSWKTLNPSFEVNVFDKFDRENLVKEIDIVNKAYHIVGKNSAKADIWRLMYLYEHGGFYTDIDQICLQPVSEYIENDIDFVICTGYGHDKQNARLVNGFIGTIPKNPMVKYLLENICLNVINLYESKTFDILNTPGHYITGPLIIGKLLNKYIDREEQTIFPPGKHTFKEQNYFFIIHYPAKHMEINGKKIIKEKYEGYNELRETFFQKTINPVNV